MLAEGYEIDKTSNRKRNKNTSNVIQDADLEVVIVNVCIDNFFLQGGTQEFTFAQIFEGLFARRSEGLAQCLDLVDQLGLGLVVHLHELILLGFPARCRLQLLREKEGYR